MSSLLTKSTCGVMISIGAMLLANAGLAQTSGVVTAQTSNQDLSVPASTTAETAAWQIAYDIGTRDAIMDFLADYPDGAHAKQAKLMMIDLLWVELDEDQATQGAAEPTPVVADVAITAPEITALPTGPIELVSLDGFVAVEGVIIAYDSALITVETTYGTVGIENDGISCVGATCPTALLGTN